jgi:hypothetical protein
MLFRLLSSLQQVSMQTRGLNGQSRLDGKESNALQVIGIEALWI